jgi:exodeoxyribonuclease V alpha subunit
MRAVFQTLPPVSRDPSQPAPESLSGLIERVTFHNEETGFAVLRVKVQGRRDLVTVVGSLPSVTAGEWISAEGRWARDREHGLQLQAEWIRCSAPTSREGIEKYLGSGLIKGIGPVHAGKLVKKFGEGVFDVIEQHSVKLEEVEGIGPKRRREIKAAWAEQKVIRAIMVFLHSHGVSTSRAVRIFKAYGEAAIEVVRENPYRLARDISGIGFKSADGIAQKLGIPSDSLMRASAGLTHTLLEATGAGHCALPRATLVEHTAKLLGAEPLLSEEALARQLAEGEVVEEQVGGESLIFLPALRRAEEGIAEKLRALAAQRAAYPGLDVAKAIAWCEERTGKQLAASQREAIAQALRSRVLVITGGPGVGKTTLLHSLLLILRAKRVRCLLCAPTGRAAKRLAETTGLEARTIHRLLGFKEGGETAGRTLTCDLLVVDETSMVDVLLMHRLLRALPSEAHLLLVGDVDQLPSVGPGMVLGDIIASGAVPVVRLTEIFRQAATSRIITNAHRINQGEMPELPGEGAGSDSDFHFIEREEPEAIQATVVKLIAERIPKRLGSDPIRDIQLLCPMNRGSLGAREMNRQLQAALNPHRAGEAVVERFGWQFRLREKVLQTENNYDKDVFNGDIGQIVRIDAEQREAVVRFEGREVVYDFHELDELSPAYAITIHKSQGSEFPVVVVPLAMQHFLLLQRNLIYTAVTRGRGMVVLVGQRKALGMAIRNAQTGRRYSGLLDRLRR